MKDFHPKSTKSMRAVGANMVLTECCEPDCGIPFLIEKGEQNDEKKNRCTSCLMKLKLSTGLNK